jgi:hypothetical protein
MLVSGELVGNSTDSQSVKRDRELELDLVQPIPASPDRSGLRILLRP